MTRPVDGERRRLRLWLAAFLLAMSVPTAVLIIKAYEQLRWESFLLFQGQAAELAARIDRRIAEPIRAEESRAFSDYAFLSVGKDQQSLRPSALAAWPPQPAFAGLVGYFQVDASGQLSTPYTPPPSSASDYDISVEELAARQALQARITTILAANRLPVAPSKPRQSTGLEALDDNAPTMMAATPPAANEEMADAMMPGSSATVEPVVTAGRLDDRASEFSRQAMRKQSDRAMKSLNSLKLEQRYAQLESALPDAPGTTASPAPQPLPRKERRAIAESAPADYDMTAIDSVFGTDTLRIRMFESEVGALRVNLLDSGHFVLFRDVWREDQRLVQGVLIDSQALTHELIGKALRDSALATVGDLVIAWQGQVLSVQSSSPAGSYVSDSDTLQGELLYRTRLSAPLDDLELVFSLRELPAGPGAGVVTWLAGIIALVLSLGCWLMYRLGLRQIALAKQQQDFVSAISHELKTPLTSIRMYGEMLREGWVPADRQQEYYVFIHDEAERLSRLIANVLQMARVTRQELQLNLQPVCCGQLLANVRSKLAAQVEHAGQTLEVNCTDDAGELLVQVDEDAFCQILINLVDNALKFGSNEDGHPIEIKCRSDSDGQVRFSVRDFGPGIPRAHLGRIFRLFYRPDNELTRASPGTGIGLALVQQLTHAMGGQVDVVNLQPGAEFRVTLPSEAT